MEIILTQLGGHLPFPYLTQKFTKETHNWSEVWHILYTHYGVQPNQQSFLNYAKLQKKDDETPLTFYERLVHHSRSHLAPGEKMNTSLLNHIALDWLRNLDLVESVETEFGNELKQGSQLSTLVPRIAHQVETLRRRSGQSPSHVQQVAAELFHQPDHHPTEQVMYVAGSGQVRRNNWRSGFNQSRGSRPTGRGGRGFPPRGNYAQPGAAAARGSYAQPGTTAARGNYCPNCRFLGQELRLQVSYNHAPGDCPRRRSATNMVVEDGDLQDDDNYNDLQDLQEQMSHIDLHDQATTEVRTNSVQITSESCPHEITSTFSQQQPDLSTSWNSQTNIFNNTVQHPDVHFNQVRDAVHPPAAVEAGGVILHHKGPTTASGRGSADLNQPIGEKPSQYTTASVDQPLHSAQFGESWLDAVTAKIRRLEIRLTSTQSSPQIRKAKSPTIETVLFGTKVICTADEGSEINCIDYDLVINNNIPFSATRQTAKGAGSTKMCLMGETTSNVRLQVCSKKHDIRWDLGKLVIVKNLGVPLIIGEPGKSDNSIITIPQETILTKDITGKLVSLPYHAQKNGHESGFTRNFLCSVPDNTVLYPHDAVSVPIPSTFINSTAVLTPRLEFDTNWPNPRLFNIKEDRIEIRNDTKHPIFIPKSKPFADLRDTFMPKIPTVSKVYDLCRQDYSHFLLPDRPLIDTTKSYINDVQIDPDKQLSQEWRDKFYNVCHQYSDIITPIPGRYNGYFGQIDNSLNLIGPPPPSIKARLPKYSSEMLQLMADKMDELESWGVLAKPEELGVTPKHVVPSMLVPKPGSPGEFRLVSDFTSLLPHIKKLETVAPSLEDVKMKIGQAKFHIELDFSNYFWQGGVPIEDIPYLATPHPFGGLRVYTVEPQGIRNASEHGAERLARIFGDLVRNDKVALIADALYILADTEKTLMNNFIEVLSRAKLAGLTFKPKKLIIAPISTTIFGWKKVGQSWLPCAHVFSPLAKAPPPGTVKKLRGFLGAYKQVSECIKDYAVILSPLEKECAGKDSKSRISWTEDLLSAFNRAKESVKNPKSIIIPRPDDILHLHPDFSQEANAVGGPLYIERREGNKITKLLGGHFSVKLREHQTRWLPCEGEALAVKLIVNHFSNYIREAKHPTIVNTDNQPIVAAYNRLKQGEFSNSSRIASFLTSLCIYNIEIRYFPGKEQKVGDFYSRNPVPCENVEKCQICQFAFSQQDMHPPRMYVNNIDGSTPSISGTVHPPAPVEAGGVTCHYNGTFGSAAVLGSADPGTCVVPTAQHHRCTQPNLVDQAYLCTVAVVTYDDVASGKVRLPFVERPAWISVQREDQVHALLTSLVEKGQKPERKQTNKHFTVLKRMYNLYQQGLLKISRDGLVTVRHTDSRGQNYDAISVPPHMLPGLVQALHVKLSHPSKAQLLKLVSRHFYCPNTSKIVDQIVTNCSTCAALRTLPENISAHSTTRNDTFGANHAADVIKQNNQLIFISREKLSQFVYTKIIPDETANSIREALLAGCVELLPESGGCVRVDPGSSLQTLAREAGLANEDNMFRRFNITIDLGRTINPNKNPVAENAVKEFLKERLRLDPMGGPITETERILITKTMNSRIRDRGVAAKEILLRRDLITNKPLDLSDQALSEEQFTKRKYSHAKHLEKTNIDNQKIESFSIGDRVFIRNSLSKIKGRDEYRIVKLFTDNEVKWANIKKAEKQFRNKSYDVKLSEITRVPFHNTNDTHGQNDDTNEPAPTEDEIHEDTVNFEEDEGSKNENFPVPSIAAPTRRPTRNKKQPSHLQDYVVGLVKEKKPCHGWSYEAWMEILDDDDYINTDKTRTNLDVVSDQLLAASPENDEEDLIDFFSPVIDVMIGRELDKALDNLAQLDEPNSDTVSIHLNESINSVFSDHEANVTTNARLIDNVVSIGKQLQTIHNVLFPMNGQIETGPDWDGEDDNDTNDENESEDNCEDCSEDDDESEDDCDDDGDMDAEDGDDENTDSEDDGRDESNSHSQDSDYPPVTPPYRHLQPPANWRGDSPRPGPAAELLSQKLSFQRQQIIDRRKSRGSSTWDHSADVDTPLKSDIHEEIRPERLADPVLSSTEDDNVFTEACRSVVPPNLPRSRLTARTLPGRTIENRDKILQKERNLRRLPRVCYKSLHKTGVRVVKQSPDLEDDEHDEMSSSSSQDDDDEPLEDVNHDEMSSTSGNNDDDDPPGGERRGRRRERTAHVH